jgi:hypothetical protein
MNHVSRLSMLAVLAAASLASHAAGIYSAQTTVVTSLSASGGIETTVLQVSVPSGTWVVSSKVTFVNFGNEDFDRCHVLVDGNQIDGATTMTGGLGGMPKAATLPNLGLFSTFVPATVKLNCWHDSNVPNQYLDPGAMLVVSRAPKK